MKLTIFDISQPLPCYERLRGHKIHPLRTARDTVANDSDYPRGEKRLETALEQWNKHTAGSVWVLVVKNPYNVGWKLKIRRRIGGWST